jgi:hypothetical protein
MNSISDRSNSLLNTRKFSVSSGILKTGIDDDVTDGLESHFACPCP